MKSDAMNDDRRPEGSTSLNVDASGVRQSVTLAVGIAAVSWASIALVFWAGEAAAGATGGSGDFFLSVTTKRPFTIPERILK